MTRRGRWCVVWLCLLRVVVVSSCNSDRVIFPANQKTVGKTSEHPGGCWGVSPSHQRWFFLLPKHSGTGTITRFFSEQFQVKTCYHGHHDPKGNCASDFSVILAANPFRRMISSAAWHGAISGGKKIRPWGYDIEEQVRHFRQWVSKVTSLKRINIKTAARHIESSSLEGKHVSFIIHTNKLQEDTLRLLDILGYPRQNFSQVHCISSCPNGTIQSKGGASTIIATGAEKTIKSANHTHHDQRLYYDTVTAAKVVSLFQADFAMFGFSTDPADMFE